MQPTPARRSRALAQGTLALGLVASLLAALPASALRLHVEGPVTSVEESPPFEVPAALRASLPLPEPDDPEFLPGTGTRVLDGRFDVRDAGSGALLDSFGFVTGSVLDGTFEDAGAGLAGADALLVSASRSGQQGWQRSFTQGVSLRLVDPSGEALESDALLPEPPELADFPERRLRLSQETLFCPGFGGPGDPFCDFDELVHETNYAVEAGITSLRVVPEPGTALLLAGGLASLGAGRRARRARA